MMTFLFIVGLSGVLVAFIQLNAKYEAKHKIVDMMSNQLVQLEETIEQNRRKIAHYDFLAYKDNAFSKRFPIYAQILETVYDKSEEYGFKPDLVLGVIKVESNFDPNAVSYVGAYGLMQINLAVWQKELNIDRGKIFDVDYNVDLGLKILKQYFVESRGNLDRALHLYNNGYKFNNTKYIGKVHSAVLSLTPNENIQPMSY